MKKKLFIVSLVLSMCFSMLSIVNVQAKETIREDHYVNPIYKDVKSSVIHHDIQTYSLEDVEYTSDQEKLVKIFREKLINRESNIVLYYHCDEEITQEFFSNLVHQLFQKAIKHTGNGKEGDYLKWHCQGWTVKASISGNSNEGYGLNIFYDVSYLSSLEQEEKVDEEVSNLLKSLDLSNKTDYQKVKAIYDYICSNVTYDHDNLNDESYSLKYTAYAALINKTAVCQGYASLFYRLALDAGVDTRVISGEAGGPHAWNIVKLNGKYYNLDSTWDAGRSTYAYFLKNTNDFDDHVRDNDYQSNDFIEEYPMWDESYTEIDCNKYGHNYDQPIYTWSSDNQTVTAKRICLNNGLHIEEETVTAQKIVKDPTCTENGIITYIANFKNNAFKSQTKIVDGKKATGHKVVVDQGKKATCTEDGLTEGKHCSVCKEVIKKQEVIPATGHKVVVDQAKEATCAENGLTEGSHCSVCNEVIKKQEVIPATGHKEVLDSAKEATCTNTGLTEGIHCSICNKIIKKQEIIPALGHDFKDGVCTRCHNQLKGQWKQSGNKWWYQYEDGTYPKNEFITIDNKLYRFDQYGYMQTGWFKVNNEDYYATSSGEIKAQWVGSGNTWYYVDADGKMVTGFQTISGTKYYFETNGLMKKGWFKVNGTDYYASTSGEIKAQWVGSGNTWYYVDADGKMVTGFQTISGAKYYFANSGLMQKGWFKVNGADYYATSSGAIKAQWVGSGNTWYYVDADGKMVTGYQTIAGAKYYFAESGLMQTGWFKINGEDYYAASSGVISAQWVKSGNNWYYVDADGKMVTGDYAINGEVNRFDANGVWLG
ncbi:transglutaminase domain-containing protein [Faecalibacillus intestinalis]|uniref:transglutaminase domain-containing protein n=1 Tax=Faecalibacillus intestinalis TaxID=1982626 RepID=UPI001314EDC3